MEKHPPLPMTQFDTLTTNEQLLVMKCLLPYVPVSCHRMLAFYIKFAEFRNTMQLFEHSDRSRAHLFESDPPGSFSDLLDRFRPFLDPEELGRLDTIMEAMQMMELMKDMDMSDLSGFMNPEDMADMMDLMNTMAKGSNDES